ncbi:MAG: Tetraacyldisaccharide 4'-kinase [Candidatus Ozemobacter sibiricus]|jgi:tetraacyldisaccharide 4'-kinase|uniref:Tetraacyldisaccharide 4'-kinase n=1 Tax=Candidatus Ozemobacter sibiricus TaxID=2268124 RepID=A0A367ZPR5_9BACT|nr:MAG: Tetraacyldisaccharide 4'-kinase [Candidatus Ozemobacter sibiricus]
MLLTTPPVRRTGEALLLQPVAWLYGRLVDLERRLFGTLPFLVAQPAATVVSIGNLTVGGTGKTPLLLELLADPERPAATVVLTRGYRSAWERSFYLLRGPGPHPAGLTDEALQVNAAFPHVPVLLGKNRAHTATMAEKWFHPDLLLLDDGFQYRRVRHDVDLVLWDATTDPAHARLLPLGRLREPPARLAAAHALLLTRCETATPAQIAAWRQFLTAWAPAAPLLKVMTEPRGWLDPAGHPVPLDQGPRRVVAFAALAHPAPFFALLAKIGCQVVATRAFRDHHVFTPADLDEVGRSAADQHATPVCTDKDRIKIDAAVARRLGVWTLLTRLQTVAGEAVPAALRRLGVLPWARGSLTTTPPARLAPRGTTPTSAGGPG